MSGRTWNEHQRRAIGMRGQSVVVSAAAGSGKTSVLTERVMRLIEEGEDLSRMLIVTFTNLAAGEMRARIYQRLQQAGRDDARLAAQAEKCAFADISTLHAFCGRLIRDNFAQAGVSPTFAIADEAQTARLMQDAVDGAIEGVLAEQAQRGLVLKYAGRGDMQALRSIILTIYNRAVSLKSPAEWLDSARAHFDGGCIVPMLFTEYKDMALEAACSAAVYIDRRTDLWRGSGFEAEALRSEAERAVMLEAVSAMTQSKAYLPAVAVISADVTGAPNRGSRTLTGSANKCFEALRRWEGDFDARVSAELKRTGDDGRFFIDLTRAFMSRYTRAKQAKNLLDHDDMMHLAIRVLKQPDIAARYRDRYAHVFVDEYQDINEAQHAIISALQRGDNDFLVGDVKQCIYMFRESNPELLMRRCRELDGTGLIEMNTNYRSAPAIIRFINGVMSHMMTERAGGVAYTGGQSLAAGASGDGYVEIVLAGRVAEEDGETLDSVTAEAAQLAALINGFVEQGFAYGDIAVLRPELSGTGQQLSQALRDRCIPVTGGPAGDAAFSELAVFINLLRVIDSPTDDVPLLSVLRYPYFGLTEADFAHIRLADTDGTSFAQAARVYHKDDETGRRLKRFWEQIDRFGRMAACMKLPDFLMRLRQEACFREYALTSPGGYGTDEMIGAFIGAAAAAGPRCLADVLDTADRVRTGRDAQPDPKTSDGVYLTTIHRSKGLEFPVVILCGLHKVIDQRDAKGAVLVGRGLGIGLCDIDEAAHIKKPTFHSTAVARGMKREKISETVRLLYVGMTRAVSRLVLLGAGGGLKDKWLEDKPDGWQHGAHTYFDLLMPAVRMACEDRGESFEDAVRILPCGEECAAQTSGAVRLNALLDAAAQCEPAAVFARYAHQDDIGVPSKVSVSALKRLEEQPAALRAQRPPSDDAITAAERGTLMHRVLEVIGLDRKNANEVAAAVERLAADGAVDPQLAEYVDTAAIARFLDSGLAARARESAQCLFEQPFCVKVSARELNLGGSGEAVVVQGVIDMCFIEDGKWVTVDYKTDRVSIEDAPEAAVKYATQLALYARALEDITEQPVAQKWIYYLTAGQAVRLM